MGHCSPHSSLQYCWGTFLTCVSPTNWQNVMASYCSWFGCCMGVNTYWLAGVNIFSYKRFHCFFSIIQLGIVIVNDFKSIEGDRAMGLQVLIHIGSSFWIRHHGYFLLLIFNRTAVGIDASFVILHVFDCKMFHGQSLPVAFGIDTAKWICAASIDLTQLAVAGKILHDVVDINFLWILQYCCWLSPNQVVTNYRNHLIGGG